VKTFLTKDRQLFKLTSYLLLGWVAILLFRYVLARIGDPTIGAYISFVAFWLTTLSLVGVSIWSLASRKEGEAVQFMLILIAFISFVGGYVASATLLKTLCAIMFFLCAIGIIGFYGHRTWRARKDHSSGLIEPPSRSNELGT
jgi:hypothetical protein